MISFPSVRVLAHCFCAFLKPFQSVNAISERATDLCTLGFLVIGCRPEPDGFFRMALRWASSRLAAAGLSWRGIGADAFGAWILGDIGWGAGKPEELLETATRCRFPSPLINSRPAPDGFFLDGASLSDQKAWHGWSLLERAQDFGRHMFALWQA